jgi:hypothetical protein
MPFVLFSSYSAFSMVVKLPPPARIARTKETRQKTLLSRTFAASMRKSRFKAEATGCL